MNGTFQDIGTSCQFLIHKMIVALEDLFQGHISTAVEF